MREIKKSLLCVLVLFGGLLCVVNNAQAADLSPEKSLEKGIEAYRNHDNSKAMDYFIDVLMNGDAQQQARANNYINAIHNQIGGIESPVEVDLSFPQQPTQTMVDSASNLANYGTERLEVLGNEGEIVAQEVEAIYGAEPKTLTEQIEARQLADYTSADGTPVVQQQTQTQAIQSLPVMQPTQTVEQPVASPIQANEDVVVLQPAPMQEQQLPEDTLIITSREPVTQTQYVSTPAPQMQPASSTFVDLTSDSAVQARSLYTVQKLQSMTDAVETALKNTPGVHLYLRSDGLPDAIDVDDGVLFKGNSFRPEAFTTLNNIYELLALTQGAGYTILPSGSYTDDVTLSGIRQAMALKSYLVKRGISQGKLSYNMGLVDEEVPAKFSNLKGLSIVFDYDAKLPTRLLENEDKITGPLLSMAIVPPCHAIDRALGEAYAVDFSVLETTEALDNWVLQVVLHGRDGKYYVVRQLEGFSPVYHEILWNGRKGIIGPELPCGKYTFVLTGVDLKGNKQVIRRRVVVKCAEEVATTGSCQTGKCPAVTSTAKTITTQSTVLNYKSARLWKKPGRIMRGAEAKEVSMAADVNVEGKAKASVQTQGDASSTYDSTYTHTKTVRNIVTTDNSPAETVTTSSSSSYVNEDYGSQGVVTNPYEMPYESEYSVTEQ